MISLNSIFFALKSILISSSLLLLFISLSATSISDVEACSSFSPFILMTHLKLSKLSDNNYYYFDYSLKKDKEYTISLTIKNSNDPISVYALDEKPRNSTLTFNGESQDNIVALSFMYGEKSYFNVWYSLMGIVLLIGCLVMTTPNRRSNV